MPVSPTEFGGVEQRRTMSYYPGNPVASTQIYGTQETENTFSGVWNERYLTTDGKVFLDNMPLTRVKDIVSAVEGMVRECQKVKVEWADVVRYGYMNFPAPEYYTREKVEWQIDFTWTQHVEEADPPHTEKEAEASKSIGDAVDFLKQKLAIIVEGLRKVFEGYQGADDALREVDDAIKMAEVIASLTIDVVTGAKDSAERVLKSAYTAVRLAMNGYTQALTVVEQDRASYYGWAQGLGSRHKTPPADSARSKSAASRGGLYSGSFGAGLTEKDSANSNAIADKGSIETGEGSNLPGNIPPAWFGPDDSGIDYHSLSEGDVNISRIANDPAAFVKKIVENRDSIETLRQSAGKFALAAEALRQMVKPVETKVYITRKDEDLRRISVKYYGTMDRWQDIATANNIEGSLAEAGTKLTIP